MTSDIQAKTTTISQTSKVGRKKGKGEMCWQINQPNFKKQLKPMIKKKNVNVLNVIL